MENPFRQYMENATSYAPKLPAEALFAAGTVGVRWEAKNVARPIELENLTESLRVTPDEAREVASILKTLADWADENKRQAKAAAEGGAK